ncbi:hypothetical protein KC660_00680 [Candidatus Dojkabacteria bacterium]|uniref:Uncharacterized protein n=1 Tax=Candidatus Dojkabacteria bacterium TaxID=2099670 RepID=A0A955L2Y4_9BACT|nr:hypothetical protein [Candidatus Dojkabacteria bacterium]
MLKLSDATQKSRYLIIVVLFLMVMCTVTGMINRARKAPITPVTLSESRTFGDLPPIKISELNYVYKDNLNFELNTISGRLPVDEYPITYIYKFSEPVQSLTAKEDAGKLAKELGYFKVPQVTDARHYKWSSLLGTRILQYDSLSKEVSIQTDLNKDPYLKQDHEVLANTDIYKEQFKSFLSGLPGTRFPADYAEGNSTVEYLIFKNNKFERTIDASSLADFFEINLFRQVPISPTVADTTATTATKTTTTQIGGLDISNGLNLNSKEVKENLDYAPVFNDDPFKANIRAIIAGDRIVVSNIVEFNMNVHEINYEEVGAYKIITYEEAYNKLIKGDGNLVYISDFDSNKAKKATKFSINNAKLGYFEGAQFQQFIQPIYIFSGIMTFADESRADFYFYIPAIK